MRARLPFLALLSLLSAAPACGPTVDLTKSLEVLDVNSGWFDAGIVNGQNKLVPSISFKLKNVSSRPLAMLQANALFRHGTDNDEWGSAFVTAAGSDGLAAGATTATIVMKSPQGYTSIDPRQAMLQNSHFVDAQVELTAKYGSTQWVHIGKYTVKRTLLTQ